MTQATKVCTRHAFTDGRCLVVPGGCHKCPGERELQAQEFHQALKSEALLWVLILAPIPLLFGGVCLGLIALYS